MPHVAPLPIIEVGEYKLMVDTGCVVPNQLVYPSGYNNPPKNLNVLGNDVPLTPSPWGNSWLYADHQPMFENPLVGEGQAFDFLLTLGWCRNKTISFTHDLVTVVNPGQEPAQNQQITFFQGIPVPFITFNGELYLLDTGIPFSTKFEDLEGPNDELKDYQLCFSPLGGGILKIQTTPEQGLMWLTGWSKMNRARAGTPVSLADAMRDAMRNVNPEIVGCIGSDYLLNHDLTISFPA